MDNNIPESVITKLKNNRVRGCDSILEGIIENNKLLMNINGQISVYSEDSSTQNNRIFQVGFSDELPFKYSYYVVVIIKVSKTVKIPGQTRRQKRIINKKCTYFFNIIRNSEKVELVPGEYLKPVNKIQNVFRSARKNPKTPLGKYYQQKKNKKMLNEELKIVPPMGIFPGGIDFQEAEQRYYSQFGKGKCKPSNTKLYSRIKQKVKKRVKRWPSAYASGQLVQEYKRKGGKYSCNKFGSLNRWFDEKWIDVCTGKKCGRGTSSKRKYPYCRPSKRISSKTPRTVRELSRSEIKRRCAKKRKLKGKRMNNFGKNQIKKYYSIPKGKYPSFIKTLKGVSGRTKTDKMRNVKKVLSNCRKYGISLYKRNGKTFKEYRSLVSSCNRGQIKDNLVSATNSIQVLQQDKENLENELINERRVLQTNTERIEVLQNELEYSNRRRDELQNQLLRERENNETNTERVYSLFSELKESVSTINKLENELIQERESVQEGTTRINEIRVLLGNLNNEYIQLRNTFEKRNNEINEAMVLMKRKYSELVQTKIDDSIKCKKDKESIIREARKNKQLVVNLKNKLDLLTTESAQRNELRERMFRTMRSMRPD